MGRKCVLERRDSQLHLVGMFSLLRGRLSNYPKVNYLRLLRYPPPNEQSLWGVIQSRFLKLYVWLRTGDQNSIRITDLVLPEDQAYFREG